MKHILSFFFVFVLLLCGCSSSLDLVDDNETPSELSCYVFYGDRIRKKTGEEAFDLYSLFMEEKIVWGDPSGFVYTPKSIDLDSIQVSFYCDLKEGTEYYGEFKVYSDGVVTYSRSPYYSASFDYQVDSSFYSAVAEALALNQ